MSDPNLLIGTDHFSDAGVYRLADGLAIVQTVDFFSPIVDDPYIYGQIAAANALSDCYAMGAQPKTVLNIVCFPDAELELEVLTEILGLSPGEIKSLKEDGVITDLPPEDAPMRGV